MKAHGMADSTKISDAEWLVMQIAWERREVSAADVIERLSGASWSHRTIRTLLARLVSKGALKTSTSGRRYLYRPAVAKADCVRQESRSFLKRVFAGNAAELLVHFVRDARIDPQDIERLQALLDEKVSKSSARSN